MKVLRVLLICTVAITALMAQTAFLYIDNPNEHASGNAALLFSQDGSRMAITVGEGEDRRISLWDSSSGRIVSTIAPGPLSIATQFSPDAEYLSTATRRGEAAIWKVSSGERVTSCCLESVLFGPSEQLALVGSSDGMRVVHLGGGQPGKPLALSQAVGKGRMFLGITPEGTVQGWAWLPLAVRTPLGKLKGGSIVQQSDSSRDGCVVITTTRSPATETQVWDVCHGRSLGLAKGDPFFSDRAALSSDGSRLLTFDGNVLRLYRLGSFKQPGTLTIAGTLLAADPTALSIVSWNNKKLEIRDVLNGQRIATMPDFEERPAIRFSSEGGWMITVEEFKSARLWDAHTGERIAVFGTSGELRSVIRAVFSPEGSRLGLVLRDGTVEVWTVKSFTPRAPHNFGAATDRQSEGTL